LFEPAVWTVERQDMKILGSTTNEIPEAIYLSVLKRLCTQLSD